MFGVSINSLTYQKKVINIRTHLVNMYVGCASFERGVLKHRQANDKLLASKAKKAVIMKRLIALEDVRRELDAWKCKSDHKTAPKCLYIKL
jgi:hypothetical protein